VTNERGVVSERHDAPFNVAFSVMRNS